VKGGKLGNSYKKKERTKRGTRYKLADNLTRMYKNEGQGPRVVGLWAKEGQGDSRKK
jgi:hypothetical protein